MSMASLLTVYVVCSSKKEAEKIAVDLVRKRLAACVNYFPCRSVFKWEGKLRKASEWVLLAKTTKGNYPRLEWRVKKLHSYETPCVVAWKDQHADAKYSAWVKKTCSKA